MTWPSSQDYNEAVQDTANFTDPALQRGEVVLNALGLPVPRSGNFADVYQFKGGDSKLWALKCFTRKVPGLRERYAKIDEHLAKAKLPFAVGFKFFQEGIQVKGQKFPLLKMEWVEGFTLNDFVAQNLTKPHYLHALMQMWAKLAGRLRGANMAHADLQHGNVLLVPGATPQKLGLKLIDYDGMWVPALAERHSGEVGHPNFQHPLRLKEKLYNGDVDRFPHLVIATGLRATLIGGKAIWERFDNEDNLLFKEADLRDPAKAPVFKALWELNDPVLRTLVGHIALSANKPLGKTPWLDEVLFQEGGPRLSAEQEREACAMLGVAPPSAKSIAAATPVEQAFNVFQFFDEDETPNRTEDKPDRRPTVRRPQRKAAKKSKTPLIVGGIAVAAMLVVGAIVAFGGGSKPPTNETVQRKDDDKSKLDRLADKGAKKDPIEIAKAPIVPIDAGVAVNNKEDLRQVLADTQWDWGDATLELKADGSTYQQRWDDKLHLTTRWEALDRRTALLIVDKGRQYDRCSILEFSEDLGDFSGFDYGATRRMPPKKRVGTLARSVIDSPPTETKTDLQRRLAGSTWEWGDGRLTLRADGHAEMPTNADGLELVVRWEAIDQRTALLIIEKGRDHDRIAVLQFSNNLGELTGYDFENRARLPVRKRIEAGTAPPPDSPKSAVIGVATLTGSHDYLFIRKDDPTLYVTQDATAKKARALGKQGRPIRTIAVAPDGMHVIGGDDEGIVRLWNIDWPTKSISWNTLKGANSPVICSAISPNGEQAVTIDEHHFLYHWSLKQAKLLHKFQIPEARAVAFMADGKSVVIGTEHEAAGIWNLATQKRVRELPGHQVPVRAVCVSPRGDMIWTADEGGQIRSWELPNYEYRGSTMFDKQGVSALALAPDGRMLAVTGPCGAVRGYGPRSGARMLNHIGKSPNYALSFADDGQRLIVGRDPLPLVLILRPETTADNKPPTPKIEPKSPADIAKAKEGFQKQSEPLSDTIVGCTFSTDGKKIYAATHDGMVHVLNTGTLEVISKASASKVLVSQMAFAPKTPLAVGGMSPERLYLLDVGKEVHVWDPAKGTRVKKIELAKAMVKMETIDLFTVTATESFLLAFDRDRVNSMAWDLRRGAPAVPPILNRAPFAGGTRCVAFTADGRIGAAQAGGKLLVWNVPAGTNIKTLDIGSSAKWIGVIPEASAVAVSDGNRLQFWNYSTGKEILNVNAPHGGFQTFVAATPLKGNLMVTAGSDRTLRVWDAKAGGTLARWEMEQAPEGVTVSQDGKFAAVWHGNSNTISLWAIAAPAGASNDRLVGKWLCGPDKNRLTFLANGGLVEHLANGALNSQGSWKVEGPDKYTFQLRDGRSGTIALLPARDKIQIEMIDLNGRKSRIEGERQGD